MQQSLLDSLLSLVGGLDTVDGAFAITEANLGSVDEVIDGLRSALLSSDYVDHVREFAGQFDEQKRLNDSFFGDRFTDFKESTISSALLDNAKKSTVNNLVKVEFVNKGLYDPIRKQLDAAVSLGAPLTDTIKQLRLDMVGGKVNATTERLGLLHRYAKQIAFDSFAVADATYTKRVAEELGVEWFRYMGGTIEPVTNSAGTETGGTRDFCESRNGNYYHKKEIERWVTKKGQPKPSGEWSGKVKGTNKSTIFNFRGGWNCRHSFVPTSEVGVPKKDLRRALASGDYEPTDRVKKLLGIDGDAPLPPVKPSTPPPPPTPPPTVAKIVQKAEQAKRSAPKGTVQGFKKENIFSVESDTEVEKMFSILADQNGIVDIAEDFNTNFTLRAPKFSSKGAGVKKFGQEFGMGAFETSRKVGSMGSNSNGNCAISNAYLNIKIKKGEKIIFEKQKITYTLEEYLATNKKLSTREYRGKTYVTDAKVGSSSFSPLGEVRGDSLKPWSISEISRLRNKNIAPTITHEGAHLMQFSVDRPVIFTRDPVKFKELFKREGMSLRDSVTLYGETEEAEFWAENFTAYVYANEELKLVNEKVFNFVELVLRAYKIDKTTIKLAQ
jgi:hypothetical protein